MFFRDRIYEEICENKNISKAWKTIRRKNSKHGVDQCSVYDFEENLLERLGKVRQELVDKNYKTDPIKIVYVKKKEVGKRPIGILTVRDRIVQRALHQVIAPILDKDFESVSYGYRCGYSPENAARKLVEFANQGLFWIVDLDIEDFFSNISHELLIGLVKSKIKSRGAHWLLKKILNGQTYVEEKSTESPLSKNRGLLQGSLIAPIMANLYLDPFDKYLVGRKIRHVRFADDVVILTNSREKANYALKIAEKTLAQWQLKLNVSKTQITHFAKGFRFLGMPIQYVKNKKGAYVCIKNRHPKKKRNEEDV